MLPRSLTASLVLGICAIASAQSAVIKYKFHKGETHGFSMDMSMKMNLANQTKAILMDTSGVFKQSVKSVAQDGTGTVILTVEKMTTEMNGRSSTTKSGSATVVKIAPNGSTFIVSGEASKSLGNMQMMSNFPKSPVRAGSTWQSNFNLPGAGVGGIAGFKLTNKVDRIASSGGQTLAYIHSFGNLDMGKLFQQMGASKMPKGAKATGGMSADLHYVFNISAGTVQSMDGSAQFAMNFSGMGSQSGSTTGAIRLAFRLLK